MTSSEPIKEFGREKTLRELIQDFPNSSQRVVGDGLVRVDAEEVRQSANYKEMVRRLKELSRST